MKRKTVFVQTVEVERRAAITMTTLSTSTATTTTNQQILTENKRTNENLPKTPPGKTNINKKEKEKATVNQNSTENIKGNENAEKEVQNTQETEGNRKSRTTKKVAVLGDSIIKHLNGWKV